MLIHAEVGSTAEVAPAIRDLNGVERAEDVADPCDVIAHVQASSPDKLGWLVLSGLQAVDGVTRTLTCSVISRYGSRC
jgi:DNA-binding Lrp family transcriptional regulator